MVNLHFLLILGKEFPLGRLEASKTTGYVQNMNFKPDSTYSTGIQSLIIKIIKLLAFDMENKPYRKDGYNVEIIYFCAMMYPGHW